MFKRPLEIALAISADRNLPPAALAQTAQSYKASGVVDIFHIYDQMQGWWPAHLWNTNNAPLAAFVPDLDSYGDPSAVTGYVAASAPGLGLTISTDGIRRGPAEVMQTMLTLANMGEGNAILQIGAGEIKQTGPYGWKRNEGLRRLEDHFRFYDAFWNNDGEVDFEGNFWKFDNSWLGKERKHKPRVWSLGGGPKLVDLATTYNDGFATSLPNVIATPERYATFIRNTRQAVEAKGRDPEKFEFCLWVICMIHEDPEVINRAFDNPLVRWFVATCGRFNQADWAAHGIEPIMPLDWHYSMKLIPHRVTDRQYVDQIIKQVPRRMCELSFVHGNVDEVARQIQPYIDAGATCLDINDMMPLVLDPAGAQASVGRQLQLCAKIKEKNR